MLSPRESSSILAAARVLGEHGAADFCVNNRSEAENGIQKEEQAWQLLKAEQLEKDKIVAALKAREEEIDSLHELLWCSEVAPTQARKDKKLGGAKIVRITNAHAHALPHAHARMHTCYYRASYQVES